MPALNAIASPALAQERTAAASTARDVEIRFTALGVAHVKANTWEGLGYGYGWAFARDNLCLAVDHAVTLAGERSSRIAPDSAYLDAFANLESGAQVTNFESDVFYRALLGASTVRAVRAAASMELRALMLGYVRGFNAHVASTALPGESCRTSPWFRALVEDDVWRRAMHLPMLETSNGLLLQIVRAAPPSPGGATSAGATRGPPASRLRPSDGTTGSNAAAFGRQRTLSGRGMSFANPHFPWTGIERLHAVHLTIPGQYDVFGAALYNLPFPVLGFNRTMGWGISTSTDQHATIYELDLDPKSPTRYHVGDRMEAMTPVTVDVPVKSANGTAHRRRTLWKTRHGWMVVSSDLPWSAARGYAIADPELDNVRVGDQFLDIGRAPNVRALKTALDRRMGVPWSNVTAADADGDVLFANSSLTPDVDDARLLRCGARAGETPLPIEAIAPILTGADTACAWRTDPRAVQRGTVPAGRRPFLIRSDFAINSNDSHWLATDDPRNALEGFARTIGDERTIRGERTRIAILLARGRMLGNDGLGPPGVDAAKWETLFFRSRNLMAELWLDDLLVDCRLHPRVTLGADGDVDLGDACAVLERWDRTDRLDSRGSLLFLQFLAGLERRREVGLKMADRYWRVPFDPQRPVITPRGLLASDEMRVALARAVRRLSAAGIALDAPLRSVQYAERNGERLPISGSGYTYNLASGLAPVRSGNSYMHIVDFMPDGPRARFIVTYSQSTNPASGHFADMTRVFSSQSLTDAPFDEIAIARAQVGETVHLRY